MKESDKRGDIIQASLDLIVEHGFHGAPMSMIAKKAGVGAGTIYRYFENKDVLITELHRELEEQLVATCTEGYSKEKPIRERFFYCGITLLRYFVAHPITFRFIEQYYNSPYGVALRRNKSSYKSSARTIFNDLFEQAKAEQIIKDLPLFVHAALVVGPIVSLVRDHILGVVELDDAIIMESIEAIWDGIKR
jgi:AcrR family transcriptional regulator